jgi:hypothetical protein
MAVTIDEAIGKCADEHVLEHGTIVFHDQQHVLRTESSKEAALLMYRHQGREHVEAQPDDVSRG